LNAAGLEYPLVVISSLYCSFISGVNVLRTCGREKVYLLGVYLLLLGEYIINL
jgi:hypothetical protein